MEPFSSTSFICLLCLQEKNFYFLESPLHPFEHFEAGFDFLNMNSETEMKYPARLFLTNGNVISRYFQSRNTSQQMTKQNFNPNGF
jgi:hypothetical protein